MNIVYVSICYIIQKIINKKVQIIQKVNVSRPRGRLKPHGPFASCSQEVPAIMSTSIGIERSRQDEARVSGSFNGDQYMFVEKHTESCIQLLLVELDRCMVALHYMIRLIIQLLCSQLMVFFFNVNSADAIIVLLT